MNTIYNLKKAFTCTLLLLFCIAAKAQQTAYTQYMDNLTAINPVASLFQKSGSVNVLARKQWLGIPGAPASYLFNGSLPIESINASAGLIVSGDEIAIEHFTQVNAFLAKAIRLNKQFNMGVSVNAGFDNYVAKYSEVDPSDPTFSNDIRQSRPNVGLAVMLYSDQYYVGLSVPQLDIRNLGSESQQDNVDFRTNYCFVAGAATNLNEDYKMRYSGLLSYTNGVPVLAEVSAIAIVKNTLGFGLNYKTNNEVAALLSINYQQFHIGYSYEFATSSNTVGSVINSTSELTLGYRFGKNK